MSSKNSKLRILNQKVGVAPHSTPRPPSDLSLELQRTMLQMKGEFMTDDGKGVDYAKLTQSELFGVYQSLAGELVNCDLSQMSEEERKAFFISILYESTYPGTGRLFVYCVFTRELGAYPDIGHLLENCVHM